MGPFCAGVQFSGDSFLAFNDRRKIRNSVRIWHSFNGTRGGTRTETYFLSPNKPSTTIGERLLSGAGTMAALNIVRAVTPDGNIGELELS